MVQISAGLLMYRRKHGEPQFFIVHPGGPFWKNKNAGAWSIPKGGVREGESLLECAKREFYEETGIRVKDKKENYIYLGFVKLKSGKIIYAWAFEGDWSGMLLKQSMVDIKLPWSNKRKKVPEIDKAGFFPAKVAKEKLNPAQAEFVGLLEEKLESKEPR